MPRDSVCRPPFEGFPESENRATAGILRPPKLFCASFTSLASRVRRELSHRAWSRDLLYISAHSVSRPKPVTKFSANNTRNRPWAKSAPYTDSFFSAHAALWHHDGADISVFSGDARVRGTNGPTTFGFCRSSSAKVPPFTGAVAERFQDAKSPPFEEGRPGTKRKRDSAQLQERSNGSCNRCLTSRVTPILR